MVRFGVGTTFIASAAARKIYSFYFQLLDGGPSVGTVEAVPAFHGLAQELAHLGHAQLVSQLDGGLAGAVRPDFVDLLWYLGVLIEHLHEVIYGQELVIDDSRLEQVVLAIVALDLETPLFPERYLLLLVEDAFPVQREPTCEVLLESKGLFHDALVLHKVVETDRLF